jgi:hypothetical protein
MSEEPNSQAKAAMGPFGIIRFPDKAVPGQAAFGD